MATKTMDSHGVDAFRGYVDIEDLNRNLQARSDLLLT
ncbi:protein of unknown function (plasmid) [Caballeronia sp. S22]